MDQKNALVLRLELIWWLFTALVVIGVLFPILKNTDNYPFLLANIIFIVVFITLTRYFFLLKHTFLAKQQVLKVIAIVACIPLLFYLVNQVNLFQTFLDENGIKGILPNMIEANLVGVGRYVKSEMLLFGVGSIIITAMFPIRMLTSIWKTRNRGTA